MVFNDNRQEGKTDLDQAKIVMLNMMSEVHLLCKRFDITYWIDSGTLLGAVRHGGFIPWDDDLDICMPREDYNRFISEVADKLPNSMFLQTKDSDPFLKLSFAKVRDNYSTIIENKEKGKIINYHQGIFIDIFPVDYVDNLHKFFKNKRFYHRDFLHKSAKNRKSKALKYLAKYVSEITVKSMGKRNFLNLVNHFYKKSDGKYIVKGIETTFESVVRRDIVFPLKEIEFEGKLFSCPNDSNAYLKSMFGNYMELPPEDERRSHAYKIMPQTKCKKVLDFEKKNI